MPTPPGQKRMFLAENDGSCGELPKLGGTMAVGRLYLRRSGLASEFSKRDFVELLDGAAVFVPLMLGRLALAKFFECFYRAVGFDHSLAAAFDRHCRRAVLIVGCLQLGVDCRLVSIGS